MPTHTPPDGVGFPPDFDTSAVKLVQNAQGRPLCAQPE